MVSLWSRDFAEQKQDHYVMAEYALLLSV